WSDISAWGEKGWDAGSSPLVVIYHRDQPDQYSVCEYVEGDVTVYTCPTKELRNQITDEICFFHWKFRDESWVKGYDSVDELPDELKGPYRNREKSAGRLVSLAHERIRRWNNRTSSTRSYTDKQARATKKPTPST